MHMPAFSFQSFVDPLFRPFRPTDHQVPSLPPSDHLSDEDGQGKGRGRGVGMELSDPTVPPHKRLVIIKVTTFSVGPLPFGNGIIHGFLVTAEHATPTQLKDIINGAIKVFFYNLDYIYYPAPFSQLSLGWLFYPSPYILPLSSTTFSQ